MVVMALVAVLALVGVGGVLAWLVSTDSLTNTFGVGAIGTEITEDFPQGGTVKQNVKIKNNGNIDAWIRAQVNIYWVDANGNQLWDVPAASTDYALVTSNSYNWLSGSDGYYYYVNPVAGGGSTDNLIDSLTTLKDYDDGRKLVCDIAAQAIQADPYDAVEEAWGATVTEATGEGQLPTLTPPSGTSSNEVSNTESGVE